MKLIRRGSSSEKTFALSVVIPTTGKSPHLRGLLERLQLQVTEFQFEVLVVANIPSQALRKLVNSMGAHGHGTFDYLETGRLGVNLARNKGLERAHAPIVLFLDDDAILDDDGFLAAHRIRHDEHPDAVAIGGPYHLTQKASVLDRAYHEIAHDWLHRHTMSENRTTQLLGGNMSLKKDELKRECWTFDEAISFGGAETGLCLRISNAGRAMYFFDSLSIGHAPDLTIAVLRKKAFLQGAGASWRAREIPAPLFRYTNEFAAARTNADRKIQRAQNLYRACFEFGWASSPFSVPQRNSPPKFNLLSFHAFLLGRQTPLRFLRRLHRRTYASVRTAWINGAKSRPLSTRPKTAR
ncbi:hypothetical protein BH10BDE1_BH10BDE1_32500 [soil metagenome]